jgi:putative effector of murein hydrolase LrgA (UPF0299 family)
MGYTAPMDILRQLGTILGFGFLGELLSRFLPLGIPASVLGLLLMLAALGIKLLKPEHLGKTAAFISRNMSFFFLPMAASVLENFGILKRVLPQFILICLAGMLVTFGVTYGTVRLMRVLMERGPRGV